MQPVTKGQKEGGTIFTVTSLHLSRGFSFCIWQRNTSVHFLSCYLLLPSLLINIYYVNYLLGTYVKSLKSIEWRSFTNQFNRFMYLLQAKLEISLPLEARAPTSLCHELFPARRKPAACSFALHPPPPILANVSPPIGILIGSGERSVIHPSLSNQKRHTSVFGLFQMVTQ